MMAKRRMKLNHFISRRLEKSKGIEPNPARFVDDVHGSMLLHNSWQSKQFFFAHVTNLIEVVFQFVILGSV